MHFTTSLMSRRQTHQVSSFRDDGVETGARGVTPLTLEKTLYNRAFLAHKVSKGHSRTKIHLGLERQLLCESHIAVTIQK